MGYVITSLNKLGKELDKMIKKDVDAIKRAAAKAVNSSARKARTEVARQEKKTLHFKTDRFKKSIKIEKATKENPIATITFPDIASEPTKDGTTFFMIPLKKGLKQIGYDKDRIVKNLAIPLLKYSKANPKKTKGHVNKPQPFFKLKSKKTGQSLIAARNQDNRKKMDWLFAGREGHSPNFNKIVEDTVNKNLEKDFNKELNKLINK